MPHIIFFPSLIGLNLTAQERENVKNAESVREGIRQLLRKRRQSSTTDRGDLLSILLEDPLFANDEEAQIDDMIVTYMAGVTTTATAT